MGIENYDVLSFLKVEVENVTTISKHIRELADTFRQGVISPQYTYKLSSCLGYICQNNANKNTRKVLSSE